MKDCAIQKLFSVDIYKTKFDDIGALRQIIESHNVDKTKSTNFSSYMHLLDKNTTSDLYAWRTTPGAEKLHDTNNFATIKKFIEHHAKIYWDALGYYTDVVPKIYQSWITHYHQDGFIHKHNHARSQLAGVLYLQASPEQGNLVFENPLELLLSTQPYREKIVHKSSFEQEIPVNTGDLILFPSYLKHYTLPNTTTEDRIIVSVNFNHNGEYHNSYLEKNTQQ